MCSLPPGLVLRSIAARDSKRARPRLTTICRRSIPGAGHACQKQCWPTHKGACRVTRAELTRVAVAYDTPRCQALRQQRSPERKSRRCRPGEPHVMKFTLDERSNPADTTSPAPEFIIAHDRLGRRYFEINAGPGATTPDVLMSIVRAITERGVLHSKGYFTVWGCDDDHVDVDVRCMMPPRPW